MARITLENLRHSYSPTPSGAEDWALKEINLEWQDGGAYALLGPSSSLPAAQSRRGRSPR